jgi:hypothetical protein
MHVTRDQSQKKIWLSQDSYIEAITARYHLNDLARWLITPLPLQKLCPNEEIASPSQIHEYQSKVGSIGYAATCTRPDIAYAHGILSQFLVNPSTTHIGAANQVIAYLYNTRFLALEYRGSSIQASKVFLTAADAAFANAHDRKSTGGFLCLLYGGPIDWRSWKQRVVSLLTTKAEYISIIEATKLLYWWKRIFRDIDFNLEEDLEIHCDNSLTVNLLSKETTMVHTKLRHVDVHRAWLCQEVQQRRLQVTWVPSRSMPADGLTKALPKPLHQEFVKMLNMVDILSLIPS